jgi:membrane dipeptidase
MATQVNNEVNNLLNNPSPSDGALILRSRSSNTRHRWFWSLGALGLLLASTTTLLNPFSAVQSAESTIDPTDYAARTKHVLSTTPLIDGHNDLPYLIRTELKHQIYNERFTFNTGLLSNTDRKKLRDGMVGGQFWSSYIHCPPPGPDGKKVELNDPTVNITLYTCKE